MSVTYFMSGACYIKGTMDVARQFNGFISTNQVDPVAARDEMIRIQEEACREEGRTEIYVHIEQFNEVRAK